MMDKNPFKKRLPSESCVSSMLFPSSKLKSCGIENCVPFVSMFHLILQLFQFIIVPYSRISYEMTKGTIQPVQFESVFYVDLTWIFTLSVTLWLSFSFSFHHCNFFFCSFIILSDLIFEQNVAMTFLQMPERWQTYHSRMNILKTYLAKVTWN